MSQYLSEYPPLQPTLTTATGMQPPTSGEDMVYPTHSSVERYSDHNFGQARHSRWAPYSAPAPLRSLSSKAQVFSASIHSNNSSSSSSNRKAGYCMSPPLCLPSTLTNLVRTAAVSLSRLSAMLAAVSISQAMALISAAPASQRIPRFGSRCLA